MDRERGELSVQEIWTLGMQIVVLYHGAAAATSVLVGMQY